VPAVRARTVSASETAARLHPIRGASLTATGISAMASRPVRTRGTRLAVAAAMVTASPRTSIRDGRLAMAAPVARSRLAIVGRVDRSRLAIRGGLCTTTMGLATVLRPTPIRGALAMTVTGNGLVIGRSVPAWGQALANPRRTAGWRRAEMGSGASDPGPRRAPASTAETDGTWGQSGTDSDPSLIHSRPGELRSVPTMMCCEPCATDSGPTEAHRRQSARTL